MKYLPIKPAPLMLLDGDKTPYTYPGKANNSSMSSPAPLPTPSAWPRLKTSGRAEVPADVLDDAKILTNLAQAALSTNPDKRGK